MWNYNTTTTMTVVFKFPPVESTNIIIKPLSEKDFKWIKTNKKKILSRLGATI